MRRKSFRTWLRDQQGIAAVEFALILGPITVLMLATFEVTLRMQAADEFERYAFQIGDVFTREAELTSADISVLYDAAGVMMQQVGVTGDMLDIDVASIGFQSDGEPVLLWRRHRGNIPADFNLSDAEALAEPGESVMRVSATLRYTPAISYLPSPSSGMVRTAFFKPRATRSISIDGKVTDPGVSWDFYNVGS